jgi:septal ring factor EnvC (AmiA/AmiB activator)
VKAASNSLHIAELEQQMRQADADWEAVTRSMQADQQRLAALERHLDRFRLLFQPLPDEPFDEAPAITAVRRRVERYDMLEA